MEKRERSPFILTLLITVGLLASACGASPSPEPPEPSPTSPPIELSPAQQQMTRIPPPNLRFERISTEDGLPQSTARCILQDAQGYMWFCTSEGAAKYNGYSFEVYKHDPQDPNSLRENRVESIYQDRSSVLWVGTIGGWLGRFDRETGQFTHYEMPSTVRVMHEDAEGTFWIGVDDAGLLRFDRATGEVSAAWRVAGVRAIFEDREGVIWVGSDDGWLARYDREQEQFVPYEVGHQVEAIAQDPAGHIWIGTLLGGLARLDPETTEFVHYRHIPDDPQSLASDVVTDIHVDSSGVLWIAAYRSGLNWLDPDTGRFVLYQHSPGDPYSLGDNLTLCLNQDRAGVLWVGTELGGISRLSSTGMHVSHFRHVPNDPDSLGSNTVTSILQDQQRLLWIGTRYGLSRQDRATGQWRHYRPDPSDPTSLSGNYVGSLYEDQAGVLWVGTAGTLNRYDREKNQFVDYPVFAIYGMVQDSEDTFWVTAADGLYRYDSNQDRFALREATPLGERSYWSMWIHEDPAGSLWMGTAEEGLARYDPRTSEWRFYQHDPDNPQSLSHNHVEAIWQDPSGDWWVGTHRGLDLFDPGTETFAHYGTNEGLPSDTVFGILQDKEGNLWLSTSLGLSRFNPETETFRNYESGDGLQGNQFSRGAFYQSASGEMFFGGNNGFNAFYPEQFTINPHPPPVVITAFSVFNQAVRSDLSPDEQIDLTHRENFVSFDFAALDYNNPSGNEYAFRMVGVDEDWVYAGTRRHADYPNLRPGDYVFRVKGSNSDGVWNEEGTWVRITIQPPFWGTWWFRGILLLVLAGVALTAYRLRVRSVELRSRELEVQVAERTAELEREVEHRLQVEEALRRSEMEKAVTAERSRLARELHDAVTQTLFSASLIAEVLPRMWTKFPERGRQQLEEVRLLTRGALAEMRSLLLELRPEALVKASMDDLLRQLGRATTGRTGVPVAVMTEIESPLPPDVQVALYRIAQEALNNAAKHAEASQVDVHFQHQAGWATLSIRDDGQ
ncbi:MAG: two-component regulator propeller domain-containing protein, partial [Anaerolineae bacterium]